MTGAWPWREWSGLFASAVAWAASSQVGYMFVPVSCDTRTQLVHPVTIVAILVVAAGVWLSWIGFQQARAGHHTTRTFISAASLGAAALFLLAILLQGASAFVFTGCER